MWKSLMKNVCKEKKNGVREYEKEKKKKHTRKCYLKSGEGV